jgi:hypothetical protein
LVKTQTKPKHSPKPLIPLDVIIGMSMPESISFGNRTKQINIYGLYILRHKSIILFHIGFYSGEIILVLYT